MTPLAELTLGERRYTVERATAADVPAIVALLADDVLGATREGAPIEQYLAAFAQIDADPGELLVVIRDDAGSVVATMQLTLLSSLSRGGARHLLVEAVRTASSTRGTGLGTAMFRWAHAWGAEQGCVLAQLTSDQVRTDAHRFYERLGYTPSHIGFKRPL